MMHAVKHQTASVRRWQQIAFFEKLRNSSAHLENLQPRVDSVQARQIDAEALAIDGDPVLLVQFGIR